MSNIVSLLVYVDGESDKITHAEFYFGFVFYEDINEIVDLEKTCYR